MAEHGLRYRNPFRRLPSNTLPSDLGVFAPACIATRQTPCIETDGAARSVAGRSLCEFLQLSPQIPIKRSILHGFGEMIDIDPFASGQVGDGSSDFENAVISPSTQIQGTRCLLN
jgi:hypothetical protein